MNRLPHLLAAAAVLTLAGTPVLAANPGQDAAMQTLARASGCLACHRVDADAKAEGGLAPIGPSWREVAAKYQGRKDAQDKLTQTVMAGSNPYQSHWAGKVSGLAMPPNAVVIKEADASRLVRWILALDAAR
jgi:cytochrome c